RRGNAPQSRQLAFGDDKQTRTGLDGGGGEIMAIDAVAGDGEESVARLQGAAVDGNAAHAFGQCADGPAAHGRRQNLRTPQHRHDDCSFSAARTSSWSEKGSVTVPVVWPSSWPLPATISVSPGASMATASRIACLRSPISI